MLAFLKMIRPHQYIKNLLVFFPLFFAKKITDTTLLQSAILAFISFCFAASTIYIFNDIRDIEKDKLHPKKKHRPIASGKISIKTAIVADIVFLAAAVGFAFFTGTRTGCIILIYLLINFFYSIGMKNIAILDIFAVSTGFLLRLLSGTEYGAVTGVLPSHWIIIMTFLLSLFLAIAKRRDDLVLAESGIDVRKSISGYSLEFINGVMSIMSAVIIVSYLLYTLDSGTMEHYGSKNVYATTFFVLLGLLRYMQITFVEKKSGSPTDIVYKDRFLQITLVAWAVSFWIFAY
ncbi:decaprenyl-phosphate phosphoribosyltransferase [bacterium]|nr:decaprenyl-phosphate phosphoribosyltransferase [bacterium]